MTYTQPKQNDPELLKHKYILGKNKSKTGHYYEYEGFDDITDINTELKKHTPLYELITGKYGTKPYIDYDESEQVNDKKDMKILQKSRKRHILKELINIFIYACRYLGIHMNVNNVLILDGSRPMTKDNTLYYKYSFHITTDNNYVFKTKFQCAKFLLPALEQAEKELYGEQDRYYKNIDNRVYGMPMQRLRTIYSYKNETDTEPLIPITHECNYIKHVNDPSKYLVQYFDEDYIYIKCPYIDNGIKDNNDSKSMKIKKKQNIYTNDIINLLLRYGLKTPSITDITEKNERTYYSILYNSNIDKCIYGCEHDRPTRGIPICYAYIYNGSCMVGCWGQECKPKEHINVGNILQRSPLCDPKCAYQVNEKYLTQDDNNRVNQLCTQFIKDEHYKVLVIKSETGTGKTYLLKRYIEMFEDNEGRPIRVLLISTRQSYARSMCGNSLKDLNIKNYLDHKKERNNDQLYTLDRLCISMEGLNDLMMGAWMPYDIVILDESESICRHLYSPTIRNGSYDVFEKIRKLIQYSKKCIMLDADAGAPSLTLINNINNDKVMKINNTYEKAKKEYYMTKDRKEFIDDIKTDIIFNKNLYIVCLSKTELYYLVEELKPIMDTFDITYKSITGDSDEQTKKELANVNNVWSKANIVFTTSTTGAGVDFNIKGHFDKIYGYLSCGSSCPVEFIQILDRVRYPNEHKIKILIHSSVSIPNDDTFIYTVDNARHLLYDRQINTIINNAINRTLFDGVMVNEQITYVEKDTDYTLLTYYNHTNTILNNTSMNYLLILKLLLQQRGHTVAILTDKFKQERHILKRSEKYKGINMNKTASQMEDIYYNKKRSNNDNLILDKVKVCNAIGIHSSKRGHDLVDKVIDIHEVPTNKGIIYRILKTFINEEHADILKNDKQVYIEDTDRVRQNLMNVFNRLMNIIKYDYTDNYFISLEQMNEYTKQLNVTNTEMKAIDGRTDPDKVIKKILNKYGFTLITNKVSVRNKEKQPRKQVNGYILKHNTNIYSCVSLLYKKLGHEHFRQELNILCNLHKEFDELTNIKPQRIV